MSIKEVFVPPEYAPLGKKRVGYFVDKRTNQVCSIKRGYLHYLSPYQGRYHISNNGVGEWVPRDSIKRARRTASTPSFHRVPSTAR